MQALKDKINGTLHHDHENVSTGENQIILVTGGSGFAAAHVLRSFLSRGYHVRATVRSPSSGEKILKTHAQYSNQLSYVIVKDITVPGAFDESVKGVHGVIHMASPFVVQGITDNEKDLLEPAIKGTTEILKAVKKNNPSVKRVVITSSFSALWNGSKGLWPEHTYTEADWNPVTYEEAKNPKMDGPSAYSASKVFAERAAWDFVEKEKPNFSLVTVCPPMLYGPTAHEPASVKDLATSSADVYRLCNGSLKEVPDTAFFAFCDVRDAAEAHVKGFETSHTGRYFVVGGNYTYQRICDIIRRDFPERRHLTPEGNVGEPFPNVYKLDNSKSKRELGLTFRDLDTTIHDMVVDFEKIEKRGGL